ncbi:MAG: PGPGW domain-containing protein [Planctomycetota bacterium]
MRLLVKILRNILGVLLILLGLVMLVTPGQGILTIVLGFAIMDFPGKKRITSWIKGTAIARKLREYWKRVRAKGRETG